MASGWVLLSRGDVRPVIEEARARPDWPRSRKITIVGGASFEPADTLAERVAQLESWGVNYVRITCADAEQQALFASDYLRLAPARPSR